MDIASLRGFLVQNAGDIYLRAIKSGSLDNDKSLYVVTGCIKTDSWALAASRREKLGQVLRLSKLCPEDNSTSEGRIYDWTDRSSSTEARVWPNNEMEVEATEGKNQTLFLQGFKLDFSPAFRARMNGVRQAVPEVKPPSGDRRIDELGGQGDGSSSRGQSSLRDTTSAGSGSPNSTTRNASSSNDIQVYSFPQAVLSPVPFVLYSFC